MNLHQMAALLKGPGGPKKSKYGAKRTQVDGLTFDSAGEARRWRELLLLQRGHVIHNLARQVRFPLVVQNVPIAVYVADFTYNEASGLVVVEDFKSGPTAQRADYRLKKKLMQALYGIALTEVYGRR